ncbi:sensor histidine kinase [Marinicella sediminis]|uniref:Sensor histidine kinase n=2 Tax=Marinicella sediminis TaxID=1792834 RepID=A0ABV7J8Z8_9GAMM
MLQLLFWTAVFMINLGPEWQRLSGIREAIEVGGLTTVLQGLLYVLAHNLWVPRLLNKEKIALFFLAFLLSALFAAELYILVSYLYLEPAYPLTYGAFYLDKLADYSLLERLGFSFLIKYILLSKLPTLSFPAVILIAVSFYQQQKQLLALKQQKQEAELNALKNQLNPHFIFNTLNNIYSMAINGSTHTAEAIAKLSGIFDYVLYQCNERYVSLTAEIDMINNYIALESLRYGDRVQVSFHHNTKNTSAKVAPLLYLSLVENAFKHGASQALNQAEIDIDINADDHCVTFNIRNTKPNHPGISQAKTAIGSDNLKKQLELLYPGVYQLHINETDTEYFVSLELPSRGGDGG